MFVFFSKICLAREYQANDINRSWKENNVILFGNIEYDIEKLWYGIKDATIL